MRPEEAAVVRSFRRRSRGRVMVLALAVMGVGGVAGAMGADLQWDGTSTGAGGNGGGGVWSQANVNWWNPATLSNVSWGAGTHDGTFGGSAGSVTMSGTITAGNVTFNTAGYVLTLDSTDRLNIQGAVNANVPVTFKLKLSGNSALNHSSHWDRGLQFTDNVTLGSNVTIQADAANQYAIVGITGAGKTLSFAGTWIGAPVGSENSRIGLAGGAKFLLKAGAQVNNNQPDAINARRWDVASDGNASNVVEFEEGFDADIAKSYAAGDGLSTFRYGDGVTWITHHTRSLPSIYKLGNNGVQTHHGLVDIGSSNTRWRVATNAQYYDGQMGWARDWTLETQADLVFDGFVHGNDLTPNGAAVAWYAKHAAGVTTTMTKVGSASLVLQGEQGYRSGSTYDIQEGSVRFDTDPSQTISFDVNSGNHLNVKVSGTGVADFNLATGKPVWWEADGTGVATFNPNPAPGEARTGPAGAAPTSGRVFTLQMSNGGTTRVATGKTVATATLAVTAGTGTMNVEGSGVFDVTGAGGTFTLGSGAVLNKTGSGTLKVDAGVAQAYTGTPTVNVSAGALRVDSASSTGSVAVGVSGTGVLSGIGSVPGVVTVGGGGSVLPGNSVGTLTVAGLTLNAGSVLGFELGAAGVGDRIVISGSGGLNIAGGTTLNLSDAGGLGAGTYTLLQYSGALGGVLGNLTVGSAPAGYTYTIQDVAGSSVNLVVAAPLYWDTNLTTAGDQGGSGTWSDGGGNWWNGSANTTWSNASGGQAVFRATAGTVTLGSDVVASEARFETAGYKISAGGATRTLTGKLTSTGNLEKVGPGVVTVTGDVNIGGNLTVETANGGLVLQGSWLGTGDIVLKGTVSSGSRYDNAYLAVRGLQFVGGGTRTISSTIRPADGNADPIFAVRGNTTVEITGFWKGDEVSGASNVDTLINLTTNGKLLFKASSHVDLINTSYFTRQFWVSGDGTGTIEFADGFVSDRTLNGTTPDGIGSYRLGNVTLITHSTVGLPVAWRPGGTSSNGTSLNGHFVWETQAGGKWIAKTHAQEYKGGFWVGVNMGIQTDVDVTHTGVTTAWSDYTNYGAFQTNADGVTITKTGVAALILDSEQSWRVGSVLDVQQGRVDFNTNPGDATVRNRSDGGTTPIHSGQHLTVLVADGAEARFQAAVSAIVSLQIADGGTGRVSGAAGNVLRTQGLGISGSGVFDVTDGVLAVEGGTLSGMRGMLLAGQVVSTDAGAIEAVGYALGTAVGTVNGYTPGDGEVIAVLAYAADANLDGLVDVGDLGVLASNWNGSGKYWTEADFNYDGFVNVGDLGILASAWNAGVTGLSLGEALALFPALAGVAAPEPASLAVLAFGAAGLLRRRR